MAEIEISKIQLFNPWWVKAELISESSYLRELKREKFVYQHPLFLNFPITHDAILTLRGPRRIGKTTLLMQIIEKLLLEKKIPPLNILYYPCESLVDFQELLVLLTSYLDYIRPRTSERIYLFLDEISFVREWQRAVKQLADQGRFAKATILITGSNILDLLFSSERMPNRRGDVYPWDIEFLPLNFKQYLSLVVPKEVPGGYFEAVGKLPILRKHFQDFLLTGGFPVTINGYHQKGYLEEEAYVIFLSWIEGDIHAVGKSEATAYNILRRLFTHLTSKTSFYKLTRESGLTSHQTTQEYLDIFEKMFLTFRLPHFNLDQRQIQPRKNQKFYFLDPFIYNTLQAKVAGFTHEAFRYSQNQLLMESNLPVLVENAVASFLFQQYPQTFVGESSLGEVDIVGFKENNYDYFEVKYQKQVSKEDFQILFQKISRPLFVLTRQNYLEEKRIKLIPAEAFLAVGI